MLVWACDHAEPSQRPSAEFQPFQVEVKVGFPETGGQKAKSGIDEVKDAGSR